ncbi:MAG: O-antigen ligase family protein [Dehalococcoidia bacterium]|nr:O-antigen ligase family protein [Dehalococcoidia bacterium]
MRACAPYASLESSERAGGIAFPLLLVYFVVAGAGLLVPLLNRPVLVLAPIGLAAAFMLVARRMDLGIYLLIASTAFNRYNFEVAGWNAKVENIVLLVVLTAWALRVTSGRDRAQRLPFALLIGLFLLTNVLSSVMNSADVYKSMRIVVRMTLAVALFYLIFGYVSDRAKLLAALRALLITGAGACAFGVGALIVWHLNGWDVGVQHDPITGVVSAKGTLWEGNIFGSYAAGIAVLSGSLLVSRAPTLQRGLLSVVFVLAMAALIMSLTRAAWVAFAAAAVLAVVFLRGVRLRTALLVTGMAAVALTLVFRFDLGGVPDDVSARFATLSAIRSDTNTVSRLKNIDLGLDEWRSKPLLGWGTDGFHINHPEILSALPSPQLATLYDTGIVGLVLFAGLVGALLFHSVRASARAGDEQVGAMLGALTIAAVAQLVAFQATDAFWLGFIWVYFGLMMGAVRLLEKGTRVEDCD